MFTLPGILLLLATIYIRPQEFIESLQSVPLLYMFLALALFGLALDLRLRRSQTAGTPQLGWALLFYGWCVFTVLARAPGTVSGTVILVGNSLCLYLLIGHGVQTFRAYQVVTATLLVLLLFVAFVGVGQGLNAPGCFVLDAGSHDGTGTYDGRPCQTARDCYSDDSEPGAEYQCELPGMFGTESVGGRVRYRGPLNDPNELSLAIGVGLPFAFAFYQRRRSGGRLLILIGSLALIATCTVFTQSRGGQLVFLAVLGTYFVRQYGLRGAILGAVLAAPMLLLGGRSGEEAESSSLERIGCMYEGMSMFRAYPIIGVGQGQFVEHHTQTAHNSYVLACAELGFIGMVIWIAVLYISMKVPVQALRRLAGVPGTEAEVARTWALSLVASFIGMFIGIFFLSFCYHPLLWTFIGLSAGFSSSLRTHLPDWKVEFTRVDLRNVVLICIALCSMLWVYTRVKGAP